jgi:anti-sigma factor RsiW
MKPCSKNRKLLAWLALGSLDDTRATALREHVATCDGCRRYLDELAKVTATLSAAEMKTEIVATESFHRRVVAAVKGEEHRLARSSIGEIIRGTLLNWRVALPTLGGIALVVVVGLSLVFRQGSEVSPTVHTSAHGGSERNVDAGFRPTIANYQMVANQSLEKLDELLSEQGSRRLAPAPVYTASPFIAADVSN